MIGIVTNPLKNGAKTVLRNLTDELDRRKMCYTVFEDAKDVGNSPENPSCLIVIGGDGSILRFAAVASGRSIPLIGVNIGRIGFLTEVPSDSISALADALQTGVYSMTERMMLACSVNDGRVWHCLNDVVVFKRSMSGVTQTEVLVDGKSMGSVFCDGVICATPTGSTGYSLSAGGPVLIPETEAFVVTPVCSHTLHVRPTVVPPDATVELRMQAEGVVSVDGFREANLNPGDVVRVTKSERKIRFLHLYEEDLFKLIREKLN